MPPLVLPQDILHNRPEENTLALHEIHEQEFVDTPNDSCVDDRGNSQPDEPVYQELPGALLLNDRGVKCALSWAAIWASGLRKKSSKS